MEKKARYYELDWLRTIVILNLIPFHAAWLILSVPGFSRAGRSLAGAIAGHYLDFCSPLHMFLLFLVSGASVHMALGFRGPGTFVRERIKRLLIPLVFFMLALFPVLAFYWPGVTRKPGLSAYLAYWPQILKTTFYNSYDGGPQWAHLWFVAYLFIFSLLMLPLFLRWRHSRKPVLVSKLAAVSEKPGGIFIFALPLILIFGLLTPIWPFYQNNLISDWGYFSYNLAAFVYGFVLMVDNRFWQAIDRVFKRALWLGLGAALAKFLLSLLIPGIGRPDYTIGYTVFSLVNGLNTWFWIVGILGLARKKLTFNTPFLSYFTRISYAFYIIHLVVMVAIGWYLTRLQLGFLWEFILLSILSLAATLLCCELVRRLPWVSPLFGIKKSRR